MRPTVFVFAIALAFAGLTYSQDLASQTEESAHQNPDHRIRVVVDVVSVDAIVTDKENRYVKDLEMKDFEIYQDGELQTITNFAYVNAVAQDPRKYTAMTGPFEAAQVFDGVVSRQDILRSIAVVVDDIGMSFENLIYVRQALKQFVKEQIHPTDLVAISLTSSRTGALAQFTTNRQLLNAAVERIRWGPVHRALPLDKGSIDRQFSGRGQTIEERNLAVGTLHSMEYTLESMESLPGRKSLILISEGFRLWYDELEGVGGSTNAMVESLRGIMNKAHRSGAVIYAIDPRGGESLGLHPRDDFSNVVALAQEVYQEIQELLDADPDAWRLIEQRMAPGLRLQLLETEQIKTLMDAEMFAKIGATRLRRFYQTQQGLNYLPVATGGLYFKYNNDINENLGYVLDDQQGYYLIGYAPDPESVRSKDRRRFPWIKVKVKREGLKVRGRATFMGTLDSDREHLEPTPEEWMYHYMTSPFSSGQIDLKLTALYEYDVQQGSFVSCWLHVDSGGLSFSAQDDGWREAEVEVWAAAFGENPKPESEKRETHSFRVRGQSYQQVLRDGLVYKLRIPVERPGPHELRMVLRDKASGRMGNTSRFIQIPDIEAGRLALSGIVLRGSDSNRVAKELAGPDRTDDMPLRRFRKGTLLNFALFIYNAELDRAAQLETQLRLYKEGREIYAGRKKKKRFDLNEDLKNHALMSSGFLQLGSELNVGHYALQYTVTDKLADDNHATVSQWIDFHIVD